MQKQLDKLFSKPKLHILTVVRDHMSGLLYAVPYLRLLRERFPQAKITLLANPYAMPILEGCPHVDEVIPFFEFQQESGQFGTLKAYAHKGLAWLKLVGRVDLVVHFRYVGGVTVGFCHALLNPIQVGYQQGRFDQWLDINLGRQDVLISSREANAVIMEAMGLDDISHGMEVWLTAEEKAWATSFLQENGWQTGEKLFVFHPGCHWGCNQWLLDRWSMIGDALTHRYGGKVVITGDEHDTHLAAKIAEGMQKQKPIDATSKTTLRQFAAILSMADMVVSVDTAPTQICQALRVPAVVMVGEGNAVWNSPLGDEPMVMLHNWDPEREENLQCDFAAGACNGPRCSSRLVDITTRKVLGAIEELMRHNGK